MDIEITAEESAKTMSTLETIENIDIYVEPVIKNIEITFKETSKTITMLNTIKNIMKNLF